MALPVSGTISLSDIQTEFGGSNPISISEYYRGGGLVPNSSVNANVPTSGQISFSNFYGAQNRNTVSITISTNQTEYNLFSNVGSGYIAGLTDVIVTINSGVTIGSNSTGSAAFVVSGFTSGDTVSLTNRGTIVGKGGSGGAGGNVSGGGGGNTPLVGSAGSNGGNALSLSFATSITNNGTLAGGGGGGGGGGATWAAIGVGTSANTAGGGGGGGAGSGDAGAGGTATGATTNRNGSSGNAGTSSSSGSGGAGGVYSTWSGGTGGSGGGLGSNGSTGATASGGANNKAGGSGGSAGNYITGNSYATWIATGTRLGGAS